MRKEQSPKVRPRAALIRSAVLALACMLVAAGWAANRSAQQGSPQQSAKRARRGAASARIRPTAGPLPAQAPAPSAWRYDVVVKRNLFMPPVGSGSQKPSALAPLAPMPVGAFTQVALDGAGAESASPGSQPPQWVYAGYVTVDGNPMAIVENSGTKIAEFLRVGQTLDGFAVAEVKPEAVQLTRGGETKVLPISDAFTATPLNEPPKPQAAASQGRGNRGGFPGGGGGFFRQIMPVLRDNPELADQARSFLDSLAPPGGPAGPNSPPPGGAPQPGGGTP